jgi:hypothetical protein
MLLSKPKVLWLLGFIAQGIMSGCATEKPIPKEPVVEAGCAPGQHCQCPSAAQEPFAATCVARDADASSDCTSGLSWSAEVFLGSNYSGSAPLCTSFVGLELGWTLEIEATGCSMRENSRGPAFSTGLQVKRIDTESPCGFSLVVVTPQGFTGLDAGTKLRLWHTYEARDFEGDVSEAFVLRDMSDRILLAYLSGTRPGVFDSRLLSGLTLAVDDPVCPFNGDGDSPTRAYLSVGAETCSASERQPTCCSLFGQPYELLMMDAHHEKSPYTPVVSFMLTAPGLTLPVPGSGYQAASP